MKKATRIFVNWLNDEKVKAVEVKRLCKEFGFTAGMLKGSLAEGRKAKQK